MLVKLIALFLTLQLQVVISSKFDGVRNLHASVQYCCKRLTLKFTHVKLT